jgi:hypothetical protein
MLLTTDRADVKSFPRFPAVSTPPCPLNDAFVPASSCVIVSVLREADILVDLAFDFTAMALPSVGCASLQVAVKMDPDRRRTGSTAASISSTRSPPLCADI